MGRGSRGSEVRGFAGSKVTRGRTGGARARKSGFPGPPRGRRTAGSFIHAHLAADLRPGRPGSAARPPGPIPRLRPRGACAGPEGKLLFASRFPPHTLPARATLRTPGRSRLRLYLVAKVRKEKKKKNSRDSRPAPGWTWVWSVVGAFRIQLSGDTCTNAENTDANARSWLWSPCCVPGSVLTKHFT